MRILHAFSIKFILQTSYITSFTALTAIFVGQMGIEKLPLLLIASAALTIVGTFLYSFLIAHFESKQLILSTALISIFSLIALPFVYDFSQILFFYSALAMHSILLLQIIIISGIYIEGIFTPLEFQRALPIIDSSEAIGGIAGGLILILISSFAPITTFVYVWIVLLILLQLILIFSNPKEHFIYHHGHHKSDHHRKSRMQKIRKGMKNMWGVSFVRALIVMVFLQWVFISFLNFQYTKAVEHGVEASHASEHFEDIQEVEVGPVAAMSKKHSSEQLSEENALSFHLGKLHLLFSVGVLLFQLFLASRLIQNMGTIGSMLVHPIISIISVLGLVSHFGVRSAILTKGAFEITTALLIDSYHNSIFAVREHVREPAKEFLEGFIKPFGIIVGTSLIIAIQYFVGHDHDYTSYLNWAMLVIMVIFAFVIFRMQSKYTDLTQKNLSLPGDHPEKLNAIEILSQKGHKEAPHILSQFLIMRQESNNVRKKIIESLGEIKDPVAIPDILDCFSDSSLEIKIAAVRALGSFKNLGRQFLSQAFAHYRVINELKELFAHTSSRKLRGEIINVFSNINQSEIIPFLLEVMKTADDKLKADCIHVCGLFHDVNAGHYIEPYLEHSCPRVRANAIIALWQFKKYRLRALQSMEKMLSSSNKEEIISAIYVLGEINAQQERQRLQKFLLEGDDDFRRVAAISLGKIGDRICLDHLVEFFLHEDTKISEDTTYHFHLFHPDIRKTLKRMVHMRATQEFHKVKNEKEKSKGFLVHFRMVLEAIGDRGALIKVNHVLQNLSSA